MIPIYIFCGSVVISSMKHWGKRIKSWYHYHFLADRVADVIYGKLFGNIASYSEWKGKEVSVQTQEGYCQFQLSYNLNLPAMICWVNSEGLLSHFHYIWLPSSCETNLLFENLRVASGLLCYRFTSKRPCHINDVPQEVFLDRKMQSTFHHVFCL